MREISALVFFFFNDTATTEIYTLSLHDALPISQGFGQHHVHAAVQDAVGLAGALVHVHAAAQEVVTDLGELDAQVRDGRVGAQRGDVFKGEAALPDRHGRSPVGATKKTAPGAVLACYASPGSHADGCL